MPQNDGEKTAQEKLAISKGWQKPGMHDVNQTERKPLLFATNGCVPGPHCCAQRATNGQHLKRVSAGTWELYRVKRPSKMVYWPGP